MVLPNGSTGFSSTVKIMPCCTSSGNDSGVHCDRVNTCYSIGFNDGRNTTTTADACPAGSFTGPILVNNNTTRIDNQTQAYAYCTGFSDGSTAH